jgi:hypothetical protein
MTVQPKTARRGPVGPVAFASLRDAAGVVRLFVRDLNAGIVGAREAKGLIELFGEMTRLCGAGTTLLAPRVADTKVWADDGARTPAEWMSRVTGEPIGQTIGMLETAERLSGLPATEAALRDGQLSPGQARAITHAAVVDPTAEAELLATAPRTSLRGLEERARAVRDAARPEETEARYRAAHAGRDLSTWVDTDGAGRLAWRGTPDALAGLKAAVSPFVKEQLTLARREGRDEPYGACAADALCVLADAASGKSTGTGTASGAKRRARPVLRARFDYSGYVRGHTEAGEICEIEGVGSVPVSVIERLAGEHPIVDLVLTNGRDVTHIAHLGRSGDTFLKAAIEWRSAPTDGHCRIEGCHATDGLEIHHTTRITDDGTSSMETEVRICAHHHDLVTHKHYQLQGSHQTGWWLEAPGRAPPPDTG